MLTKHFELNRDRCQNERFQPFLQCSEFSPVNGIITDPPQVGGFPEVRFTPDQVSAD